MERRPVAEHETISCIPVEPGDFFYDIMCEPMIDEFILFIFNQPFLECQHAPVFFKPEHIDECIQVEAGITIRSIRDFQSGFFDN